MQWLNNGDEIKTSRAGRLIPAGRLIMTVQVKDILPGNEIVYEAYRYRVLGKRNWNINETVLEMRKMHSTGCGYVEITLPNDTPIYRID